ncbi:ABC transporter substrate binding protein [Clostridium botulinum]|uniref:ABC transporter substrate binding protein n=1 Tax=Clostridium botulinum TaxID=1491 RepID=UPI0004D39AF0|nr:ABC transporter substrate binding protein [Clostridium botulinum]KEI05478.1 diguanylate cyclase [Clostridium botulinum C/D str. BKT75002]KEI09429.1 diguanylate cyclase [Clostridium botulinum C/D str. BKT2873]
MIKKIFKVNKKSKFTNYITILMGIVILSFYCTSKVYAMEWKNVLILNSYNEGLEWTRNIEKGIYSVLKDEYEINLFHEYMDTKNLDYEEYLTMLNKLYEEKYSNKKLDLIICCDNDALNFVMNCKKDFLKKPPVVFCGINEFEKSMIKNRSNCTGVVEKIDIEATVDGIFQLQPNTKNIIVITDSSTTGRKSEEMARNAIGKYKDIEKVYFYRDITQSEFYENISNFKDNTVLLDIGQFKGENGTMLSFSKTNYVLNRCKLPVYVCWRFLVDDNIMGGKVISGYTQGTLAGKISMKVLKGVDIEEIPIIKQCPSRYIFNYEELIEHGIDMSNIPTGATIINKPSSFYENNKVFILSVGGVILILLLSIIILFMNIKRRVQSEKQLMDNYEQLTNVYEEVFEKEEQLKINYCELKNSQEKLRKSKEKYKLAIEGANDAIWEWDVKKDTFFVSKKWTNITGYKLKDSCYIKNRNFFKQIVVKQDYHILVKKLKNILRGKSLYLDVDCEIKDSLNHKKWITVKGKALKDKKGNTIKIAGSITDITERKKSNKKIEFLAYNDILTGLPNRIAFLKTAYKKIEEVKLCNKIGAMIFIDIDNFKNVNDTLGHDYGNELLKQVSKRISDVLSDNEIFYRLSGDEFLILQCGCNEVDYIKNIADMVLGTFNKSFNIGNEYIYTSASMGISLFPKDNVSQSILLKNADIAMYKAKELGKNTYLFYDISMSEDIIRKTQLEEGLRYAIDRDELKLVYQPQVDAITGKIKGGEVLLRWISPKFGFVSPSEFIPVAEKSGLINSIGKWILKKACLKSKQWLEKYNNKVSISVNVSVIQLQQEEFLQDLKDILHETKLPPETLELEITESVMMDCDKEILDKLNDIRKLGVKIALDDFGTGYSSLSYLRTLPINKVKLDKAFIDRIHINKSDKFIVENIIHLAHGIGFNVIAEGVELKEQLEILNEGKCDEIQGYYFSKPVTGEEFDKLLKNKYIIR